MMWDLYNEYREELNEVLRKEDVEELERLMIKWMAVGLFEESNTQDFIESSDWVKKMTMYKAIEANAELPDSLREKAKKEIEWLKANQ